MGKQAFKNSLEEEGLNGPVKALKQTTYEVVCRDGNYVPGELSSGPYNNILMSFNRNGMLQDQHHFNIDGVATHFCYNLAGKAELITHHTAAGSIEGTTRFNYDEAGRLTEVREEHPDADAGKLYISINVYDERGLLVEHITHMDGALHSRSTMAYDDKGRKTEQLMYNKCDRLERRIETSYDDAGNTQTDKDYNAEGQLTEQTITHYGPDGEYVGMTRDSIYKAYKPPERANEYKYDHHKNWVEEIDYEWSGNAGRPEYFKFRRITYYDEPSEHEELSITDTIYDMAVTYHPIPPATTASALSPAQWQWVAEGAERNEPFSVYRYYTALHGCFPSEVKITSYDSDLWSLKRYLLKHFGAAQVWGQSVQEGNEYDELHQQYVLAFERNKYILDAGNIHHLGSSQYEFAGRPADPQAEKANCVQFGHIRLYHPAGTRDADFEEELAKVIRSFRLKKVAEKPQISMVTVLGNSFSLKAYPVKDDFIIKDLDLNYGNGFEKFNSELMEKFRTTTQGLILFHGEPGTGKTFYVRHLLRKMSDSKKVVIYMPPNMVDHLVEPQFMTFISSQAAALSAGGKSCVLLIEDAEPLLVARDADTRIQGITNLLNMTDGLLNDMLGLQIICTFNVPLKQLDKALLRPGRLIARKEFKALPEFEANVLAHSLGIKHVFTEPATLSQIYAKAADKKMLTHDV